MSLLAPTAMPPKKPAVSKKSIDKVAVRCTPCVFMYPRSPPIHFGRPRAPPRRASPRASPRRVCTVTASVSARLYMLVRIAAPLVLTALIVAGCSSWFIIKLSQAAIRIMTKVLVHHLFCFTNRMNTTIFQVNHISKLWI
ncbi:hypothetical protein EON67_06215, partial [archaeon]